MTKKGYAEVNVDFRLQQYFNHARMFHRTREEVWREALRHLARLNEGPASGAARKLFHQIAKV